VSINDALDVPLGDDERHVLWAGLVEWGGPARCTEEMAVAMGFKNVADLLDTGYRIADAIKAKQSLSQLDWVRALLATEVVFASDVMGSGGDWSITTGVSDEDTIRHLRSLQRKIPRAGVLGVAFGSRGKS
jgi:hypothetical protein